MEKKELRLLPPGLLAYIGDGVYELKVRQYLLEKGYRSLKDIHQATVYFVRAETQARGLRGIEDILSEEEKDIVKRGRNAKTGHVPSQARVIDYRLSTGLEALFGYLFLQGKEERLNELWLHLANNLEE